EAAVVGERGQAGSARDLAGLLRGVADEGVGVFDDVGDRATHARGCLVDGEHRDARQQLAQLDQLALVARGEYEWTLGHRPVTLRCAAVRSRRPIAARSSIASSCLRSKVPCSAVPCTSISVPLSSPTTFMSTSAFE